MNFLINTHGTEKNKPIKDGKIIKTKGASILCSSYIKKGFTIQCMEVRKKPTPNNQPESIGLNFRSLQNNPFINK